MFKTNPHLDRSAIAASVSLLVRAWDSKKPSEAFFLIATACTLDRHLNTDEEKEKWLEAWIKYIKKERGIQ